MIFRLPLTNQEKYDIIRYTKGENNMSYDKLSLENWIELVNKKDEEIKSIESAASFNQRALAMYQHFSEMTEKQLSLAEKALTQIGDGCGRKTPSDVAKTALEKMEMISENYTRIYKEKKEEERWLPAENRKFL
jgi:TRAP-type uncharacterized transport system substrate-binding protein